MKKKLMLIVGIILALLIIIGLAYWTVTSEPKEEELPVSTPDPTPTLDVEMSDPASEVLPEDLYAKDFENGTPWWNAEGQSGERTYAGTTMLAFTQDGVYGYVFGDDKTLPPVYSEPVYLGPNLSSSLYSTDGFEDMIRESNGVRYVISNNWIVLGDINFEVIGAEDEWITSVFSRVPLTIDYLRTEPWKSNLESSTEADLSDPWWDGKIIAKNYKVTCPNGTADARLSLGPGHSWIINDRNIPEETLLRDGCTIQE